LGAYQGDAVELAKGLPDCSIDYSILVRHFPHCLLIPTPNATWATAKITMSFTIICSSCGKITSRVERRSADEFSLHELANSKVA
jgi:hypothetical protein